MAKNTGQGSRKGEEKERSQVQNPQNDRWTKRDTGSGEHAGEFIDQKSDEKAFKGVRKEK